MIAQITGKLLGKSPSEILVEVNGITYEILVPISTLYQLPDVGQSVKLYTHFVVREDAQILYGFYQTKDKEMFRLLIKVNGVGPKMALGILSCVEADDFVRTVRDNDVNAMVSMPGIGKKTAERLVIEMKDRLSDWDSVGSSKSNAEAESGTSAMTKDAEIAMINLGYKPQHATRAVAQVLKDNPDLIDSEQLIRLALKSMV